MRRMGNPRTWGRWLTLAALTITAGALAGPASAATGWGPPETAASLGSPGIGAVAADGSAIVPYSVTDGLTGATTWSIAERSAQGTWTTGPAPIANLTLYSAPATAMDARGDAVIAWVAGSGAASQIMMAQRPHGGTWSGPLPVGPGANFRVGMDDDGLLVLVVSSWSTTESVVTGYSGQFGGGLSSAALGQGSMSETGTYALAVRNGRAALLFGEGLGGTPTFTAARYAAGAWTVLASPGGIGDVDDSWVALDDAGNAYGIVARNPFSSPAGGYVVTALETAGGSWTATDLGVGVRPMIAADGNGNATAVWSRLNDTVARAQTRLLPAGGTWGAVEALPSSTVYVGALGTTTVIVHPDDVAKQIVARTRSGAGPLGDPVGITPAGGTATLSWLPPGHGGSLMVTFTSPGVGAVLYSGGGSRVTGTAFGADDGTRLEPARVAPGRTIHFNGARGNASGVSVDGVTGPDGTYGVTLPATGIYDVSFDDADCLPAGRECLGSAALTVHRLDGATTLDFHHDTQPLSGNVQQLRCSKTDCERRPLAGVALTATVGGVQLDATTSARDGTYRLHVEHGATAVVRPSLPDTTFRPEQRTVDAAAAATSVDFSSCVLLPGAPRSMCDDPDLAVEGIEVSQGIQEPTLTSLTKGGSLGALAGVGLAAGRTTVVRVYVSNLNAGARKPRSVALRLAVRQGGAAVLTAEKRLAGIGDTPVLPGARSSRQNSVVEFVLPGAALNAGALSLTATVDPDGAADECKGCDENNAVRVTSAPLRWTFAPKVTVVGLAETVGGKVHDLSGPAARQADALRNGLFQRAESWLPVANGTFAVDVWRGAPVDITATIQKAAQLSKVEASTWAECAAQKPCAAYLVDLLVDRLELFSRRAGASVGHVFAIAPSGLEGTEIDGLLHSATAATSPTRPVSWTPVVDNPATALHELMHQFGFGHADTTCGGGSKGQRGDPAWPAGRGVIGGYGLDLGVDLGAVQRVVAPPSAFYDPMSYCGSREKGAPDVWISARNWDRLVTKLAATRNGLVPTAGRRLAAAARSSLWVSATVGANDTVRIGATLPTTDAPTASVEFGDYDVVVRDTAGAELARVSVAAVAAPDGGSRRVAAVLPWASGASVQIATPAGTVLAQQAVAATPLVVKVDSPRAGARIAAGKALPVRWTVTGAAPDATLGAVLELSIDGGRTWRVVGDAAGAPAATIPAAALARSSSARLRVRVDDGLRTAASEVRGLRLAGARPSLRLQLPFRAGATIPRGARGTVAAVALDDAGRALTGGRVVWREGKRRVALGTRLSLKGLAAGRHAIVVTATDRFGRTATARLVVRVR